MYSQGSDFQHIIKHPAIQNSALCRRSVSTNQDRSFFFHFYIPKSIAQLKTNTEVDLFFPLIYFQKYCLIENEYVSGLFFHWYIPKSNA